jgi:hypothetical protein
MLVILIKGNYEVAVEMASCGTINTQSFNNDWHRRSSSIKTLPRKFEKLYFGIIGGRD